MIAQTAAALLERFEVFGRFYQQVLDGQERELRSHLEIVERGARGVQPWREAADLVAVMMNPGASRPLAGGEGSGWVPAVPDRTQYQLMKLALRAQALGWPVRHIRVINLSDLRTPKSAELFETLGRLRDGRHSIFDPRRQGELVTALAGRAPVLRAWGMAAALAGLAAKAVAATSGSRVLGLTDDGFRYRHPLPQTASAQVAWLDRLTAQARGHVSAPGP